MAMAESTVTKLSKMEHPLRIADETGLLCRVLRKIRHLTFHTTSSIWFSRELYKPMRTAEPQLDVELEFLVEDKAPLIKWLERNHSMFPWMYMPKELEQAKDHVYTCLRCKGDIIGYIKVGISNTYVHDFEKVLHCKAGTAFVYDTFVLPEYRGKNLALFTLLKTMQHLNESGVETVWCHIEDWNRASLKTFKRAGFAESGRIRFVRLFRVPFYIKNGYVPLTSLKSFIEE